jgi:hypothetical protein
MSWYITHPSSPFWIRCYIQTQIYFVHWYRAWESLWPLSPSIKHQQNRHISFVFSSPIQPIQPRRHFYRFRQSTPVNAYEHANLPLSPIETIFLNGSRCHTVFPSTRRYSGHSGSLGFSSTSSTFFFHWHYSPSGPRPASMKLSVSLRFFFLSYTAGRTPWAGDQLVARLARPLPVHKH